MSGDPVEAAAREMFDEVRLAGYAPSLTEWDDAMDLVRERFRRLARIAFRHALTEPSTHPRDPDPEAPR